MISFRVKHLSATSFILLPICLRRLIAISMASLSKNKCTPPRGLYVAELSSVKLALSAIRWRFSTGGKNF